MAGAELCPSQCEFHAGGAQQLFRLCGLGRMPDQTPAPAAQDVPRPGAGADPGRIRKAGCGGGKAGGRKAVPAAAGRVFYGNPGFRTGIYHGGGGAPGPGGGGLQREAKDGVPAQAAEPASDGVRPPDGREKRAPVPEPERAAPGQILYLGVDEIPVRGGGGGKEQGFPP